MQVPAECLANARPRQATDLRVVFTQLPTSLNWLTLTNHDETFLLELAFRYFVNGKLAKFLFRLLLYFSESFNDNLYN